jgi:hypothetical protein
LSEAFNLRFLVGYPSTFYLIYHALADHNYHDILY